MLLVGLFCGPAAGGLRGAPGVAAPPAAAGEWVGGAHLRRALLLSDGSFVGLFCCQHDSCVGLLKRALSLSTGLICGTFVTRGRQQGSFAASRALLRHLPQPARQLQRRLQTRRALAACRYTCRYVMSVRRATIWGCVPTRHGRGRHAARHREHEPHGAPQGPIIVTGRRGRAASRHAPVRWCCRVRCIVRCKAHQQRPALPG